MIPDCTAARLMRLALCVGILAACTQTAAPGGTGSDAATSTVEVGNCQLSAPGLPIYPNRGRR